jgi:hypothetical protein
MVEYTNFITHGILKFDATFNYAISDSTHIQILQTQSMNKI